MVAAAPRPKAARATLFRKETAAWLLPIVEDARWVLEEVVGLRVYDRRDSVERTGFKHK